MPPNRQIPTPSNVIVTNEGGVSMPGALQMRAHSGIHKTRGTTARGLSWKREYTGLFSQDPGTRELLSFLRRVWNRGHAFNVRHQMLPGSGKAPNGVGEGNLLDTDAGPEHSDTAQDVYVYFGSSGRDIDAMGLEPGDTYSLSGQLKTSASGGESIQYDVEWLDSSGGSILQTDSSGSVSGTSYTTVNTENNSIPTGASHVRVVARKSSTSETGYTRRVQLNIGSTADNFIGVSSGGQTGDTITTYGWSASTSNVVRAGDIVRLVGYGAVREVVQDADSDSNGNADLVINPPIFSSEATTADHPVSTKDVNIYSRIAGAPDFPQGHSNAFYLDVSIDLVEVPNA